MKMTVLAAIFFSVSNLSLAEATQLHAGSLNLNCKSEDGWEVSVSSDQADAYAFDVSGHSSSSPYPSFHFSGHLRYLEGGYLIADPDGDQFMYFNNEWSINTAVARTAIDEKLICE